MTHLNIRRADTTTRPGERIRRPKTMVNKGFAPPLNSGPKRGEIGNKRFSIFQLPTTDDVEKRKHLYTRV